MTTMADIAERFDVLDTFASAWHDSDERRRAIAAGSQALGVPEVDVARQLDHVVQVRCSSDGMKKSFASEFEDDLEERLANSPRHILHVVSGSVPGLLLESLMVAFAIGARSTARPSQEDPVTAIAMELVQRVAPDVAESVDLVDRFVPDGCDAAVVYGRDATVDLVRESLPVGAPIAAYGERESVLVVDATIPPNGDWLPAVADDVVTFAQQGCMSPTQLIVVDGTDDEATQHVVQIERAVHAAIERHLLVQPDAWSNRLALDDAGISALAQRYLIAVGPVRLGVRRVMAETLVNWLAPPAEDAAWVDRRPRELQTCVLACARENWDLLAKRALSAGVRRVCTPGTAQFPPPDWPHDGIGRFAPLLSR